MDRSRKNKWRSDIKALIGAGLFSIAILLLFGGCAQEEDPQMSIDETIPYNETWDIYTILDRGDLEGVPSNLHVAHQGNRVYMAYFDRNPLYDAQTNSDYPYRLKYYSFSLSDVNYLAISPEDHETVSLLELGGEVLSTIDVSVAAGTPMVAYFSYKVTHEEMLPQFDMGNQGDVMIALREGNTWRHEIAAYGYNPRNPTYLDGLAMSDICLLGDEDGNAHLAYQFYYEGEDSYNMNFPDARYVVQPIDDFTNESIDVMGDVEETIEGNIYYAGGTGYQQSFGDFADIVIDLDGNPVAFYYWQGTEATDPSGLRISKRIDGVWQEPTWVERNVLIEDISAAVKPDGKLAVAYAVRDMRDPVIERGRIPYCLKYAEEPDVPEEEPYPNEWDAHEIVDFTNICGRYCSLAINSEGTPVVAYYEEMNYMYVYDDDNTGIYDYTSNRFFSRLKIATKLSFNSWSYYVIPPEYIGLSNNTYPYTITAGNHDKYYIGKNNELWLDNDDRIHLCSYSTITEKGYLFIQR